MHLPPHHRAWLLSHPHRDYFWLKRQIQEGFEIHHIDGNRDNNSPDNLVLIESSDHARLHNNSNLKVSKRKGVFKYGSYRYVMKLGKRAREMMDMKRHISEYAYTVAGIAELYCVTVNQVRYCIKCYKEYPLLRTEVALMNKSEIIPYTDGLYND